MVSPSVPIQWIPVRTFEEPPFAIDDFVGLSLWLDWVCFSSALVIMTTSINPRSCDDSSPSKPGCFGSTMWNVSSCLHLHWTSLTSFWVHFSMYGLQVSMYELLPGISLSSLNGMMLTWEPVSTLSFVTVMSLDWQHHIAFVILDLNFSSDGCYKQSWLEIMFFFLCWTMHFFVICACFGSDVVLNSCNMSHHTKDTTLCHV